MRTAGARFADLPIATVVFGGASVLIFLVSHNWARVLGFSGGSLRRSVLEQYSTWGPAVAELGEWWRVFSGAFLHIDLRHLLFNMLVLFLLGRRLELTVGWPLLVGTYAVSLIGGAAGAMLHAPDAPVVGASGAVYGLMGAAFVVEFLAGGNPWREGLGSLIVVNVVVSFLIPGISIGGHLGGLAVGVGAGFAIGAGYVRARRFPLLTWGLLALLGAASFGGALLAAGTWRNPIF